ncbi:uroporphyrinogen-III C-methyltransferase [Halomonas koreensis]|uniref:Uroporphyrinogen-III C-methyltransferase n=1 Tax=Halomonas koreensis TaxID=245385 RepID=A0ABU1G0W3_9GAMM|nr:uroporphyrinogen-III C-methyltransferase [Halomonas koreensis]MDR5866371.1 uroporphyrinogen-III C-methyltransferase [Halomonas koreensis]
MSNQHNDQDEQQTPSGASGDAASATPAQAGKAGGSSSRRSRRRGKGAASGNDEAGRQEASAAPSASAEAETPDEKKGGESTKRGPAPKAAGSDDKGAAASRSTAKASSKGKTAGGKAAGGGQGGARATGGGDSGHGGGKAGALALGLVVLLGAGGGLFGWQVWQKLETQQQRLAALPDSPATQGALDDLASRLESGQRERSEALEALRGDFSDYRASVDEALDRVLEELSSEQQADERDWLHAEAAYLLRLANQRLQLERDVQGAAALLRTADERLREADNPALLPVRREIASELAALEAVPRVDRSGLYLALNAQQERIAGLPLAQDIEEIAADATIEEAPSGAWQQQLARFGEELKDLVTVRRHDEALEALITPEQESYLRQSVRLILEQAQLALLKEEQPLYDASLDKALTLIRGYYDTDHAGVQAVLSRLEELQGRAIRPELPDISGSQQALASFIDHRFEAGAGGQGDEA